MELFFAALFGLAVGSFLNVVIFRYNAGSGLGGRSRCLSCAKTLAWYELVPVLSYLAQRGRCRSCFSPLSPQYLAVELATALLFGLVWQMGLPLSFTLFAWVAISLLVVIAVYDIRHTIIPDGPVFTLMLIGLIRVLFASADTSVDLVTGLFWPLGFALVWAGSKGEWMGFGDAKLALAIGWLLPYPLNVVGVILAFWIGAAWGVLSLALEKYNRGSATFAAQIPFAPFLVLGAFVAFFCDIRLW